MEVMENLFNRTFLRDVLTWQEKVALKTDIESFNPNQLLNNAEQDLIEYFLTKYQIEPVRIFSDQISVDQREVVIDVSVTDQQGMVDNSRPTRITGTRIIYSLPYEGDQNLLYSCPSRWSSSKPMANVTPTELQFIYDCTDHDVELVRSTFKQQFEEVKLYLTWSEQEIDHFNSDLPQKIQQLIKERRQKLLDDLGMVASLGFPLKKRDDAPITYTVPITRKKIVTLPIATSAPFIPEPALDMAQYEQILSVISNMVMVIERSPIAFHNIKEEVLRFHFLIQLNGQFEGVATGETFNYQGKTDILIRQNDKNIFIAECKFWRGDESLSKTINQLLNYISWRDTKTAILVFNRNKNFSEVVNRIPDVAKKHPNYKSQLPCSGETNSRYVFHQLDDPNRDIILTIMAFNIPRPK